MQAPRHTYLPLLIPEIRENLVEIALDDTQLAAVDDKSQWWFEEDDTDQAGGEGGFIKQGPCKWHWPLDLIHLHSLISTPGPSSSKPRPLRLLLHLSSPPIDKLVISNSIDACRTQWVNQIREGDFMRWRNTSRSTAVRKADFDAAWEGIINDDFDLYTRLASRLFPLPIPPPTPPTSTQSSAQPSRPTSTDPSGSKPESAYSVRAIPVKFYLPDGAPVIHGMIPPLQSDGRPQTVISALRSQLSMLFPEKMLPQSDAYSLAIPILHGVVLPPEAELAWLSGSMCSADGWLRIGLMLVGS